MLFLSSQILNVTQYYDINIILSSLFCAICIVTFLENNRFGAPGSLNFPNTATEIIYIFNYHGLKATLIMYSIRSLWMHGAAKYMIKLRQHLADKNLLMYLILFDA